MSYTVLAPFWVSVKDCHKDLRLGGRSSDSTISHFVILGGLLSLWISVSSPAKWGKWQILNISSLLSCQLSHRSLMVTLTGMSTRAMSIWVCLISPRKKESLPLLQWDMWGIPKWTSSQECLCSNQPLLLTKQVRLPCALPASGIHYLWYSLQKTWQIVGP